MADCQLPTNITLVFILVNKVSTHKIHLLVYFLKYHLATSYPVIRRTLSKNEKTHSSRFSQRNKTLYLQLYTHYKKAFEPAEAMLIKTKTQHVICIQ